MPYIGNTAADRFVASKAASVYSGDGSTTAFTLEHSVGADEDILVSVDGVIQEPSVAYAVSSGTTLTFTAAPSSNAGNNIFVYYLFKTVGTIDHPATSALSATSGTFSGNTTVAGTLGVTGATTLTGASLNDAQTIQFGSSQDSDIAHYSDGQFALRNTDSQGITFYTGSTPTEHMRINAIGAVTMPLQPAFSVTKSGNQNNLSNNDNVTFDTEIFDQNLDFASNTFTAPITGRYQIDVNLGLLDVDSASAFIGLHVVSSNRNYFTLYDPDFGQDPAYWELHFSGLVDMDASDTITINFLQSGGTGGQTDVAASHTNFSGFLAC